MLLADTPENIAATFCATLVDEWIEHGVRVAVIAPGSRSTPLALALAARPELTLQVLHDERSAAFVALGVGLASGVPAILLCTSGTAAAHFHGAVIEAHLSGVPVLVCTADRPPELRDVGAPQTIDQTKLYGDSVRWFHDPGVADAIAAHTWRSLAAHAFASASGARPGPVHVNLPFREPLVGVAAPLPARRGVGRVSSPPELHADPVGRHEVLDLCNGRRGIIIAGRGCGRPGAVHDLAVQAGWPVIADARSGLRHMADVAISTADHLLRNSSFAAEMQPQVVLRLGEPLASKVLTQWLARPLHRGVQQLVRDLNHFYCATPALYTLDFVSAGFEWIDHTDAQRSVMSFIRRGEPDASWVVVVCNFTPTRQLGYRLGVPQSGTYRERINTDSAHYGGSNVGTPLGVATAQPVACHGRAYSILIDLPPLATVMLEWAV